jgi:hypothetical protein
MSGVGLQWLGMEWGVKHDLPVRSFSSEARVLAVEESSVCGSKPVEDSIEITWHVTQEDGCSKDGVIYSNFLSADGQKALPVLSKLEESFISFIPSYRDVLTWMPLQIFTKGVPC